MRGIIVAFAVLGTTFGLGPAQGGAIPRTTTPLASQNASTVKDPVMTTVRAILPGRQKNILAAIEAMPADKFSYKPTPDQMSFAHLVIHIAESNNGECAKIADVPAPKGEELKETDPKEKLLAAAQASFAFCSSSLANVEDSKLGDNVDFGNNQVLRARVAFALIGGWADHYGAAAMYLRLNGILPPTAQPKK
jgi:hypothetical protein